MQLFVQPLRKVAEDSPIYWSNVPFSAVSLNVFKPAVSALMEEDKWPFRPHNYAINNGVMRNGNFARLARQGVPAVLCSLMIHATSECIASRNAKSDTNAKAYGNELLNTMDEILRIALILASGFIAMLLHYHSASCLIQTPLLRLHSHMGRRGRRFYSCFLQRDLPGGHCPASH